jgi:flagellar basal body P-ring formation chaperone FlgA
MKRLAMVMISGMLAAASLQCRAEQACEEVTVKASVEGGSGELTLADLLAPGTCAQLRNEAARVSLGTVPRPGSVRVLGGREIRRRLEDLTGGMGSGGKTGGMTIPERIVVKRRGATKSCVEIARSVARAESADGMAKVPTQWREELDCAAARRIPEEATLELTKSSWSAALERWEFALRCARPGDCVPFLVWVHDPRMPVDGMRRVQSGAMHSNKASAESSSRLQAGTIGTERLVAPGQTATLTWDQAGIRMVLPVTCLDAGGLGQRVRVRLKNGARILEAEVVGEGTLRASL